jgi:hypothetical protein
MEIFFPIPNFIKIWQFFTDYTKQSIHNITYTRLCYLTAQAQKPDFIFPRNGRVHLNRLGRQFSRLLAAEVCASA